MADQHFEYNGCRTLQTGCRVLSDLLELPIYIFFFEERTGLAVCISCGPIESKELSSRLGTLQSHFKENHRVYSQRVECQGTAEIQQMEHFPKE